MNINMMLSITGFAGGMLCFAGDLLAGILGKGDEKLGEKKMLHSNWAKIAPWRISVSQLLGTIGSLGIACGFYSFALLSQEKSSILYTAYLLSAILSMLAGPIIHYTAVLPISVCGELLKKNDIETAENILEQIQKSNLLLTFVFALLVMLGGSIATGVAIIKGYFTVPIWFLVFNQLVFIVLRSIILKVAGEKVGMLPGMASLGLALMLGMVGIVAAL